MYALKSRSSGRLLSMSVSPRLDDSLSMGAICDIELRDGHYRQFVFVTNDLVLMRTLLAGGTPGMASAFGTARLDPLLDPREIDIVELAETGTMLV